MSAATPGLTFHKVDVNVNEWVTDELGVSAVPTFFIYKNAKVVKEVRGAHVSKLRDAIAHL